MGLKEIDPYGMIDFAEWQNILDILSRMSGTKSAAITKIDYPYIQALKVSASPELGFYEGMSGELLGHYCEEVFNSQDKVMVTNASLEERWKDAPEIKYGLVSYLGYPLFLPNGELLGTLCIHNDQETEHSKEIYDLMHRFKKVIEAHLALAEQTKQFKESENRYKSLVENTADAIFQLDRSGRIQDVNSEACRRYGYTYSEFLEMNFKQLEKQDGSEESSYLLQEVLQKGKRLFESTHLSSKGTEISSEVNVQLTNEPNSTSILATVRDITLRKEVEQLKEDIERITRHDLKAPLSGILGLPQALLSDQNLSDEQKEILQYIQSSGQRMLDMINMSLSLYQMEKGEYEFRPESVDLEPIIKDVEKDLSKSFQNQNSKLVLSIESGKDNNDSFWVSGEKLLCYTMLSNLIKNAVESLQYGEEVHVYLEKTSTSRARICIHNPGVIPEQIQKSFGQKYTTSGKKQGTGLGVYSARLLAETMNGSFDWSTSRESGTYVIVYLPA